MSIQLIQQYHAQVEKIIRYGDSRKETAVRKPFQDLLEHYARQRNLEMIAELEYRTRKGKLVFPDGTLKDALRQDWGYWEAKDEDDDLNVEIENKFAVGYPCNNILFEDTQTAVLYQACEEVGRVNFGDAENLDKLLTQFVSYESREVREFREAIENFTRDIPDLGEALRDLIREQYEQNASFQKAAKDFLELCQEAINPSMVMADVREMLVQHVLTEDIFITVFDEPQFHRENIIAHELGEVVGTFYKGKMRRQIDGRIAGYTRVIKSRAAQIYNHQEKQKFLKVLYENFYKAYNPKAADRLGIVYTPNKIVRFMIEAADHLCFQHFGKTLGDEGVHILDPATGTGTFITELIEYLPPQQLAHKYKHELHCNEVAILPYYIANLNIEYTYKQKMGAYEPFENIVFVDTLDNMGFKTGYVRQLGLFGLTDANSERIERQNKRDISVIIGNPPYNANQKNENENNKNREYPAIDKRIKATYVKQSNAQKTKVYDMYARFYRWASDRILKDGIVAFITNNSFVNALTFDGFRKIVAEEFSEIWILDLGGNLRRQEKGNVFGIKVGVAIAFLVRNANHEGRCKIYYHEPELNQASEKLKFLSSTPFNQIKFRTLKPDANHNWLGIEENDWGELLQLADRDAKQAYLSSQNMIFKLFSNGVNTARDEWVYDFDKLRLLKKMMFFGKAYNNEVSRYVVEGKSSDIDNFLTYDKLKWSENLKRNLARERRLRIGEDRIISSFYRPYVKKFLYVDDLVIDRLGQIDAIFPLKQHRLNQAIYFNDRGFRSSFSVLVSDAVADFHFCATSDGFQCVPLYRYDKQGNRIDNITDWALKQFRARYVETQVTVTSEVTVTLTKRDIFHYVYAVLHHPAYREKYRLNLKREFPRIPFYDDFWQWAAWGEQLMNLHLNYETITPHPLIRSDLDPETTRKAYKARLKADKENGVIHLDTLTTLADVPAAAWEYKLGNRSAIEWVLDRYKERKPRDPTIREKFNTYRFVDYKEDVIGLIGKVTAVSVATQQIINQMPK
ncbi:ATP-dependent RNA helicase YejH [hydrothermal vent metagenome]|uniref:site-specific DNA-methyltransferase (adenine-specific) n=1 Tax=hydrothermal vent metagenome TaxID=652676 RepID=A0A3B0VTM3_9ZZZZ